MQPVDSNFRRRLRREILSYWMDHPDAKDTVEGIQLWWLKDGSNVTITALQTVLEKFVGCGWAFERTTSEARRVYGLNRHEMEAISAYLAEAGRTEMDAGDEDQEEAD